MGKRKTTTIVIITIIGWSLAVSYTFDHGWLSKNSTVTYYDASTKSRTFTGDHFSPDSFTCAVRRQEDIGKWFRFEYRGHITYCYSNDLMPFGASGDYDLTPAAFRMLSNQWRGKIKDVHVSESK